MNPSFVLVLKSERCMDIDIFSCKTWHQDREFESESARKEEFLFTKFKSQIILMKKNGLNVEHFHYHININYDKSSSACIK